MRRDHCAAECQKATHGPSLRARCPAEWVSIAPAACLPLEPNAANAPAKNSSNLQIWEYQRLHLSAFLYLPNSALPRAKSYRCLHAGRRTRRQGETRAHFGWSGADGDARQGPGAGTALLHAAELGISLGCASALLVRPARPLDAFVRIGEFCCSASPIRMATVSLGDVGGRKHGSSTRPQCRIDGSKCKCRGAYQD